EDLASLVRPPLSLLFSRRLVQMVCTGPVQEPDGAFDIETLSGADADEMVALATLTRPGPFRSRTFAFGTFLGIREGGVLAAMAGQRMHLPGYREASGICTHPDFRGRGYARALVARLVNMMFGDGLTPFLHVEEGNQQAQALYRALGFAERA